MISLSLPSVAFTSLKMLEGAVLGAFFTLFTLMSNMVYADPEVKVIYALSLLGIPFIKEHCTLFTSPSPKQLN